MNKTTTIVLTLALLTTGLLVFAPAASAERECLTVNDTIHFFLTYEIGRSWGQAYSDLAAIGCPDIAYVLCVYLTHGPCAISWHFDYAAAALPVGPSLPGGSVSVTFDGNGAAVSADGPEEAVLAAQEATGLPSPGATLDGLLAGICPFCAGA